MLEKRAPDAPGAAERVDVRNATTLVAHFVISWSPLLARAQPEYVQPDVTLQAECVITMLTSDSVFTSRARERKQRLDLLSVPRCHMCATARWVAVHTHLRCGLHLATLNCRAGELAHSSCAMRKIPPGCRWPASTANAECAVISTSRHAAWVRGGADTRTM